MELNIVSKFQHAQQESSKKKERQQKADVWIICSLCFTFGRQFEMLI